MVSSSIVVGGIIALGGLYILFDDFFGGKHRAIIWDRGSVSIIKASKDKDGKQYKFKYKGVKHSVSPKENEHTIDKKSNMTFWELENNLPIPIQKNSKKLGVPDISVQLEMVSALEKTTKKIDSSWWDRNKEFVVGTTAIVMGGIIYIVSVKYAGDISPENLNSCLQIAADIKNSSLTTENNINNLIDILGKNQIPD